MTNDSSLFRKAPTVNSLLAVRRQTTTSSTAAVPRYWVREKEGRAAILGGMLHVGPKARLSTI